MRKSAIAMCAITSVLVAGCHKSIEFPSVDSLNSNQQLTDQWYKKCFASNDLDSMDPAERQVQCQHVQSAQNLFGALAKQKAVAETWKNQTK